MIEQEAPDIICGCETHLEQSIPSSEIFPDSFQVFRKDRSRNGGGVFIAVINDILTISHGVAFDADCEVIWVKLPFYQPVFIGSFYRPPSSGIADLEALGQSIQKIIENRRSLPHVILAWDFNQPDIDWLENTVPGKQYIKEINFKFLDIINKTSFNQTVNEPTRRSNILDLIFSTYPAQLEEIHTTPGMSDHLAVSTNLNIKNNRTKKTPRKIYIFKKADSTKIKTALSSFYEEFSKLSEISVEDQWTKFKDGIFKIINKYIPTKTLKNKIDVPWMTTEIKRLLKKRQRLFKIPPPKKSTKLMQRLKKISDSLKYKLKDAYNSYLTEMLEGEDENKNKKFYKFLKNRKRDSSGVPPLTNKQGETITDTKGKAKAEALNEQYQSVFTKENNQSIPLVNNQNLNMPDINFTTNGISKLLSKLNPQKANGR